MNKARFINYIIMLIIMSSCDERSQSKTNFHSKVDLTNVIDVFKYDDLIDSIYVVPLESDERCLIREIDKILFYEDICFVLDHRMGVYAFSINGDFIQKVGNIGRARGEYISCNDMSISNSRLYIYSNHGGKINCYDLKDLNFIESYTQKFSSSELVTKGEVNFALYYAKSLLSIPLEQEGMEERVIFDFIADEVFYSNMYDQIVTSGTRDFWIDDLRCEIFELNNDGSVTPHFKLVSPELILSEDELRKVRSLKEIEDLGKIIFFENYFENSKYQCFNFSINGELWDLCNDKINNKLYRHNGQYNLHQPFGFVDGVYNDFFVKMYDPSMSVPSLKYRIENYGEYQDVYSEFNKLRHVNKDDNPYLVFFKFK